MVAASGTFGHPHRPALPGLDGFTGTVPHAAGYRRPEPFAGQRAVVDAGNFAVQIAAELAKTARVTLASRAPVRFARQKIAGRDLHVWLRLTGLDIAPLGGLLHRPPTQLVIDDGRYRAALTQGAPNRRPLFTGIDGAKVCWTDGSWEEADAIVLATGYRPDLPYLADLDAGETPGTARASPPLCRGCRSSGWNGSAACRRTRCAASDGTRSASPGVWPPISRAGDGPPHAGSTCVNIDACRMRRCCRCSSPPTVRAWRRAARRSPSGR
ncbi:hypothetical protein [Streptomyces sp. 13-12-16]|uniref:hypothetical protein n=1 Tax=Streptomyces sp. 13-12-16 TaxID=1570823 RepID=UPI00211A4AF1|nr:hypothetical protein [Streptomyces sp. 13-12-16]